MYILDELTDAIQDCYLSHRFNPEKIELPVEKWEEFKREFAKFDFFHTNIFHGILVEENANISTIMLKIPSWHGRYYLGEWLPYPKPDLRGRLRGPFDKMFNIPGGPEYLRHRLEEIDFFEPDRTIRAYEGGWCL